MPIFHRHKTESKAEPNLRITTIAFQKKRLVIFFVILRNYSIAKAHFIHAEILTTFT